MRKEGRRPAILLGLRDNENDYGVIKVWARKLRVATPSLTIPVSSSITTEQVFQHPGFHHSNFDRPLDIKMTLQAYTDLWLYLI